MSWRHLPNLITAARIAMVPPLVWLMRDGEFRLAFWVALAAGASDAIDGALAKGFGWQSRLGGLLDPLADKLLIAACFVGLWSAGALPGWLLALVLGRDAVIVAGAFAYHFLIGPVEGRPTLASKLNTAAQILLALGLLTALAWTLPWLQPQAPYWQAAHALVGLLTLLSGLHYIAAWSVLAWRQRSGRS